jgi:hypothetical protein
MAPQEILFQTAFPNVVTYRHNEMANVKLVQIILLFGKQKTKDTV